MMSWPWRCFYVPFLPIILTRILLTNFDSDCWSRLPIYSSNFWNLEDFFKMRLPVLKFWKEANLSFSLIYIYCCHFACIHFHTTFDISTESSFQDELNKKKKCVEISTSSGAIYILNKSSDLLCPRLVSSFNVFVMPPRWVTGVDKE